MDGALAIRRRSASILVGGLGALAALIGVVALHLGPTPAPSGDGVTARLAQLPLSFERNAGRTDPRVDFIAHSVGGGTLYLTGRQAALALGESTLRLRFAGATPRPTADGLERLPGAVNSFIGDDRTAWRTDVPTYAGVRYHDVYPGIDVDFHGDQRNLEYDYRVAAGADPSRIALAIDGADSVRSTPAGDLAIRVGGRTITVGAPVAYQRVGGERRPVESTYRLAGDRATIDLGRYDRSRPLVIDPTLVYSTYLGGGGNDGAFSIATDSSGNIYVTGFTDSTNFPSQNPAQPDQPSTDVFVTKLDPGGSALLYSTYLGGGNTEQGNGIAVDGAGNAYVTGSTLSTNFPTQDALQTDMSSFDAFLVKLNTSGALDYSTYFGGNSIDVANAIAVIAGGTAYITGNTSSTDLLHPNAFQPARSGNEDAFVAMFNPHTGPGAVTLGSATYLGGAGSGFNESGNAIALDSSGVYVAGGTDSDTFPLQSPLQMNQPGPDGFVTKLNPQLSGLVYSTYLGGNAGGTPGEWDQLLGAALTPGGNLVVVGRNDSSDLLTVNPIQGDQPLTDVYVAQLDQAGSALNFGTYLGGALNDWAFGVAVDPSGNIWITGISGSDNFPTAGAQISPNIGGDEGFVLQLPPSGNSLNFSTMLGGNGIDFPRAIALNSAGNALIAGQTGSTDFPTLNPLQGANGGGDDAFVTEVGDSTAGCGSILVKKEAVGLPVGVGPLHIYPNVVHQRKAFDFKVTIQTARPCAVTVAESDKSQEEFKLDPITTQVHVDGSAQVLIRAQATHPGTLTNQVRVTDETGNYTEDDVDVNVYAPGTGINGLGLFTGEGWRTRIKGISAAELGSNNGFPLPAVPDDGIKKVEVAVMESQKTLKPPAKPTCEWLTKRGTLKAVKPHDGTCDEPIWLKAKLKGKPDDRTRPFLYEAPGHLPPGRYIAFSRATNVLGVTEPDFSKQLGNEKKFKVKR